MTAAADTTVCGAHDRQGGGGAGGVTQAGRDAHAQLSAAPQLPQNLAPGADAVPHWVQWATFGGAKEFPQLAQNFAPGGLDSWQLAQLVLPAEPDAGALGALPRALRPEPEPEPPVPNPGHDAA